MYRDQTLNLDHAAQTPPVVWQQTRQHGDRSLSSALRRALAETSLTGLASRHSRQWVVCPSSCTPSTSLHPFAPSPLRDFFALMGALTPARTALRPLSVHELRLYPGQVSQFHVTNLPIPLSPTTCQPPESLSHATPQLSRPPFRVWVSPLVRRLTDTDRPNRVRFLRMDRSPPAAPHPASRRRSCIQLQAGERLPGEDFHLSG